MFPISVAQPLTLDISGWPTFHSVCFRIDMHFTNDSLQIIYFVSCHPFPVIIIKRVSHLVLSCARDVYNALELCSAPSFVVSDFSALTRTRKKVVKSTRSDINNIIFLRLCLLCPNKSRSRLLKRLIIAPFIWYRVLGSKLSLDIGLKRESR